MAFQLVGFKSFGIRASGDTRQHTLQRVIFKINALNTDTALDISSDTTGSLGTFWTAVTTDSVYGNLGAQALTVIQSIIGQVDALLRPDSDALATYQQVLTLTAGNQYTVATTNLLPSIAFNSGNAPISQYLVLTWIMQDGFEAINSDLGAKF